LDYDPRYNKAYRYRPRENASVNQFWMCDEGMLSYGRAHEGRVTEARVGAKAVPMAQALEEAKKMLGSVPKGGVAVVLSAQHSLEDNWGFKELAGLLGAKAVYVTGGPKEGYADKILIHADKNANSAGVALLAPEAKDWASFVADVKSGAVTHAIALGGITPKGDAEASALGNLKGLVTVAAHEGALTKAARVVLPAASWAESAGTFVNAKGHFQTADKAIEAQGSSEPAWALAAALGKTLGLSAQWSKLKEVRTKLPVAPAQSSAAT
jgi:NADH-quinone oxidoreductase subunit G